MNTQTHISYVKYYCVHSVLITFKILQNYSKIFIVKSLNKQDKF